MSSKRHVLITGGLSLLNTELVKRFVAYGFQVILVGQDTKKFRDFASRSEKNIQSHVTFIEADLTVSGHAEKVFERIKTLHIHVLVNNTEYVQSGSFLEYDSNTTLRSLRAIEGLTNLTQLILPSMIAVRAGKILNVAYVGGFYPGPYKAVYHAANAYILSLSDAIRYELRNTGISVTTLCVDVAHLDTSKNISKTKSKNKKLGIKVSDVAERGYRGLVDNQALVVPGYRNKLKIFFSRLSPKILMMKIFQNIS